MKKLILAGFGVVLITATAWSQPQLVKDIGSAPAGIFGTGASANAEKFIPAGDILYFPVRDQKGRELWRTDGTSEGTMRVIDVNKGTADSYQVGTALGNSFVFVTKPSQLWVTTGDEAHTQSAGQITIDNETAEVLDIWTIGDKVIVAATENSKVVLFEYSAGGNVSVLKEVANDENVSMTLSAANGAGRAFVLQRYEAFVYESEIWTTDGTVAGTKKIATYPDLIEDMTAHGNDLIFENSVRQVLKVSVPAGTIAELHDFADTSVDKLFSFTNTKSLISTSDGVWVTDGTAANTSSLLEDVVDVSEVYVFNNTAYFTGYNENETKYNLYKSDGTIAGTQSTAGVSSSQIAMIDDKLIVPITTQESGMEIHTISGENVALTKDINPGPLGSDAQMFIVFKGKVFFVADDGTNGMEIWTTDGTGAGTQLLKNSVEGTTSGVADKDLFLFNNEIYFSASTGSINNVWRTKNNGADAEEFFFTNGGNILGTSNDSIYMITNPMMIYKSAGNDEEPVLVADLSTSSGEAIHPSGNFSIGDKFVFNLSSFGGSTPYGQELWTTEWQTPGAQILKDIKPGLANGFVGPVYKINDTHAVFAADDGTHGVELWITDGTTAGTTLLKDIAMGTTSSNPRKMNATLHGFLYFAANDGELWKTDGTPGGTTMHLDAGVEIVDVAGMGDEIYVTANDGDAWFVLDRTGAKIQELSSKPGEMISIGDQLFVASENTLWANSTSITLPGTPSNFYVFEDQLYFSVNGQLWHSKGTEATTRLAADIEPLRFKQMGELLYMTASSKEYGIELFKTGLQKFSQDIAFEVADKNETDDAFELVATSTSGLPVTFEVVSGNVTLSGNMVTIVGAGSVTIKAMQAGDDTFEAAETSTTFMINEEIPVGLGDEVTTTSIYPNPVEKEMFVVSPGHLRILDSNGRELLNENVVDSIDLTSLTPGFYIAIFEKRFYKFIKR